ncbi:MAG TPA: SDR family oxidoreductase [Roseococcus sp.]|nr:SDR family oxidoreductase [Roseococcus sp.]
MAGRLEGKVALITGGTSGIGEATVRLFVAEGAQVVLSGRNAGSGEAIAESLGARAVFVQADVTREEDIAASIGQAVDRFGRLDVLFNNAGGPTPGELEDVTAEQFGYAMNLLVGSVVFGMKHAAPIMRAQGRGAIINNASVAALRAHMGEYLYSMAKAAVTHATRMAGMRLGPHGITVNSISPGAIATPIFFGGSGHASTMEAEKRDAKLAKLTNNLTKANPLRRSGLPEDIARAALFLASDDGAFVNCHDLVVDAGMIAGGKTNYE